MQVDPRYLTNLSHEIAKSSATLQSLTSELSSGLRVGKLSDDPVAASANAQLTAQLSALDSFVQNASSLQGRLQIADATLGEVVAQVTHAISLATQGGDGTLNAANDKALAGQVSDIRDSVVALANTSYQGNYLFSGSQGQTRPFAISIGTVPATAIYSGDQVTSTVATPGGQSLPVNLPGSAVFLAPGASLLGALNQLVADLGTGASTAVIADSGTLSAALGTVNQQRSVLGSSLNQLTSASSYAQTQTANLSAQQSALLSADTATVATSLQTAEVQHQAMISVVSGLTQNDLFSYLK